MRTAIVVSMALIAVSSNPLLAHRESASVSAATNRATPTFAPPSQPVLLATPAAHTMGASTETSPSSRRNLAFITPKK